MEIVDVDSHLNSELLKYFKGEKDGYVQVGDKKWFYPKKYQTLAQEYKNFEVRSDDVWITGYPRSGTTLTEELTWLLTHNLDFETAEKTNTHQRVVFLEGNVVLNEKTAQEIVSKFPERAVVFDIIRNGLNTLKEEKGRRIIKTHLPFELLPEDIFKKGCKVIYVCRYPKDVCVSFFHMQSSSQHIDFSGDFEKYWQFFKNGNCMFGPYFEHVKQGFEKIDLPNVMFVFYEDFKKDQRAYIKKLSEFLELPVSNEDLKKLEHHIDFDNFQKVVKFEMKDKNNQKVNFVRSGKVGGWREHFTEEINREADEWIEMNTKKIGMNFPQKEANSDKI